jgi:hypothetical protein
MMLSFKLAKIVNEKKKKCGGANLKLALQDQNEGGYKPTTRKGNKT